MALSQPPDARNAGEFTVYERVEFWAIERLIPYGANARRHGETDIDRR
jgi:hypothetical protein